MQQSNYHDYESLRLWQTPEVEVRALENTDRIRGAGEPGLPANTRHSVQRHLRRHGRPSARHAFRQNREIRMKHLLTVAFLTLAPQVSAQTFDPVAEVLLHPRCANCHVGTDGIPLRSRDASGPGDMTGTRPHGFRVRGGDSRMGIETLSCSTCHGKKNTPPPGGAPGAEGWALPPEDMQWAARTPAQICDQLKHSARNGGRTLAEVADHVSNDPLVLWGWVPGPGRDPAPDTPARAARAILAWADAGAPCP
tara:strand:+ start:156 stop:911 length:756 start_codon:yes stop_codon:yes gene_type:complete